LSESGLEVFDDFGGDDAGIGEVGAVLELTSRLVQK